MRRFIDIISEKWDATTKDGTDVFKNPSPNIFRKIMRDCDDEARLSFCRNGDILVFDPNATTHDDVLQHYGNEQIDREYPTAMVGRRPNGSYYLMLHHAYSFSEGFITALVPKLLTNPMLIKMLGEGFDLLAENDEGDTINLKMERY